MWRSCWMQDVEWCLWTTSCRMLRSVALKAAPINIFFDHLSFLVEHVAAKETEVKEYKYRYFWVVLLKQPLLLQPLTIPVPLSILQPTLEIIRCCSNNCYSLKNRAISRKLQELFGLNVLPEDTWTSGCGNQTANPLIEEPALSQSVPNTFLHLAFAQVSLQKKRDRQTVKKKKKIQNSHMT